MDDHHVEAEEFPPSVDGKRVQPFELVSGGELLPIDPGGGLQGISHVNPASEFH